MVPVTGSSGTNIFDSDPNCLHQGISYSSDQLSKIVGSALEADAAVDQIPVRTLRDTGSMITCISDSFVRRHLPSLPRFPIGDIICIKGPLDDKLPYQDFVEQPSLVYLYYCVRVLMSRTTLFLGGHM